jgi:hypothetical protein
MVLKMDINNQIHKCPICNKSYRGIGALSRRDNKTEICSQCGVKEAMEDYVNSFKNKKDGELANQIREALTCPVCINNQDFNFSGNPTLDYKNYLKYIEIVRKDYLDYIEEMDKYIFEMEDYSNYLKYIVDKNIHYENIKDGE